MSRLIDADALRDELLWCKEQSGTYDDHWKDVIERLDAQPTIGGWISVKYRMPEKSGKYLICAIGDGEQRITTAYYGNYFYMTGRITHWRVTHWMLLPEAPKEENK